MVRPEHRGIHLYVRPGMRPQDHARGQDLHHTQLGDRCTQAAGQAAVGRSRRERW
jgi:hypothetical protein